MAVLQNTRIKGLLTAEAGITLSGGVLTAPSGTINTLTSNTITVTTSVNVGSNTTLTSDSISTDTANFTTIEADTYRNLPIASETLQGISYLTDDYLAGEAGRAVSALAVYNFYQNITGRMEELEDRVIGVSGDAFDKDPPTLWSVKNYADQMSITGGSILDDVIDSADMYVDKPAGSPTLNIHIKKFVTQTEFNVLNDLVEELTGGDTGVIADLRDRVSKIESALPISSFGSTTVHSYIATSINNRLGWSGSTTVQSKLDTLENRLSTDIDNLETSISQDISDFDSRISNNEGEITKLSNYINGVEEKVGTLQTRVDNSWALISKVPSSLQRYMSFKTNGSAGGKITINLDSLGFTSLNNASNYTYIVCLNGLVLKGPSNFPEATGDSSITDGEYVFHNGGTPASSYIQTSNSLLANQEMMVIAFGYNIEDFGEGASTYSLIANTPVVKTASKILW